MKFLNCNWILVKVISITEVADEENILVKYGLWSLQIEIPLSFLKFPKVNTCFAGFMQILKESLLLPKGHRLF